MLTFKNYILQIQEGLIKTEDLNTTVGIIDRMLVDVNLWYIINKDENNSKFNITFDSIIQKNHIDGIFGRVNSLGYYCSYFKLIKNIKSKNFAWVDIDDYIDKSKNCDSVSFYFESKFDKLLDHKPDILYHVCNVVNLKNILRVGLYPKSKSKHTSHPDRIYVTLHFNTAQKMIDNFKFDDSINGKNNEYLILKIDISSDYYNNIKLFKDPNFTGGYYTYENIKPIDIIKT